MSSVDEKVEPALDGLFDGEIYIQDKEKNEDKVDVSKKEEKKTREGQFDDNETVSSL